VSEDTIFPKTSTLNLGGRLLNFSQTLVMGIVNYTPDSFYKDSRNQSIKDVLKSVEKMLTENVDIIDLGALSSRPDSEIISELEEGKRIESAVHEILKAFPNTVISVDTFQSNVAKIALDNGALLINDISGGKFDTNMFDTIAPYKVPIILMHLRGTFETMHHPTHYANIVKEVCIELGTQVELAKKAGIKDIIIDPGFGFSKDIAQNFKLLNDLHALDVLGLPILAGISRKSMIYKTLDISPEDALNGTSVLNTIALLKGSRILRVHDVKEAVEIRTLVARMKG
jgi:dihydropteroate synthase